MPDTSNYARMSRLSAIVTILPAGMAGGWLIGNYGVDRWLGTFPFGGILLALAGAAAGFYEIILILKRDAGKGGK
jgi:hypothetical protein